MPRQNETTLLPYDLDAWRKRCGLNQEQAALTLGVSVSKLWRCERRQSVSREMAWACYGIERFMQDKNTTKSGEPK